jgi:hypothetical protein
MRFLFFIVPPNGDGARVSGRKRYRRFERTVLWAQMRTEAGFERRAGCLKENGVGYKRDREVESISCAAWSQIVTGAVSCSSIYKRRPPSLKDGTASLAKYHRQVGLTRLSQIKF